MRQGLSLLELSTSSLSSLDPYSGYVGVNISLSNSSSLFFLNVYAPLFVKAKAEAWQTTCSSLLSKSNPKSVYSFLHSVAASSSSSFSSPNFPNCSSSRISALVFADYLRSHFAISQPKALRSRARGYLSELCCATYPEESHLSSSLPFSHAELLATASPRPLPLAHPKLPIPC